MNIQNIPTDGPVKTVFIPRDGMFSFFDYQAIEPRLFAYYVAAGLGDTTIADWFREGRDVYKEIAGAAFDKPADDISDTERTQGKVLFLMTLYSAGPRKIAESLKLEPKKAREMYTTFHGNMPQVRRLSNPRPRNERVVWKPGLIEQTLKVRGYLMTPWGRPLRPEEWGEHKMLNKLIQGSAAHLMKRAFIRCHEAGIPMVATIHDELVVDHRPQEIDRMAVEVPALMMDEPLITAVVPLAVDHEISTTNWKEKLSVRQTHSHDGGRHELQRHV